MHGNAAPNVTTNNRDYNTTHTHNTTESQSIGRFLAGRGTPSEREVLITASTQFELA